MESALLTHTLRLPPRRRRVVRAAMDDIEARIASLEPAARTVIHDELECRSSLELRRLTEAREALLASRIAVREAQERERLCVVAVEDAESALARRRRQETERLLRDHYDDAPSTIGPPAPGQLERELMRELTAQRPELAGSLAELPPEAIGDVVRSHPIAVRQVVDSVLRRRRMESARHPTADALLAAHASMLARCEEEPGGETEGPHALVTSGRTDHGASAAVAARQHAGSPPAYASLAQEGRLRVLALRGLRTTGRPRQGAVLGGVLAAPAVRLVRRGGKTAPADEAISFLLRADDGAVRTPATDPARPMPPPALAPKRHTHATPGSRS